MEAKYVNTVIKHGLTPLFVEVHESYIRLNLGPFRVGQVYLSEGKWVAETFCDGKLWTRRENSKDMAMLELYVHIIGLIASFNRDVSYVQKEFNADEDTSSVLRVWIKRRTE